MKTKALLIATAIASTAAHGQVLRYNYTLSSPIPYNWTAIEPTYGDWENSGDIYGCTNWSPSTGTVGKGISFEQTATDCKQDQKRSVQPRQQDTRTGKIENSGDAYTVSRTIAVSSNRDATGILENWSDFTPTYTDWVNTNALYGCTDWSPDPSIYTSTTNFTQASSTCRTDQERERQDREQEKYTLEIRDKGAPVTEDQTLTGQSATRPYSVVLGDWANQGAVYGCSNWSPDVGTEGKGVSFIQSATDCSQDQQRTRKESYLDNQSGQTVNVAKANEKRVLTGQSNTQSAIGTREDWTATTPVYTAWTNVSGKTLYSCSNWTPTGASKTATGTFTQTSTTCSTDQTRTRQDREKEANTGAIRNNGAAVTENQTLTGQTATRSYTVTLGTWTNSGAVTSCSNWSPDPSTVTINQAFTQTATDCKQAQTRSRVESYVDHITGSTVAASSSTENQTITASSTRSATGTKETWAATTSTYTSWANVTGKTLYSCSNWTPAGSSKTATGTFTQTATNCSTDQTRTRQDREMESTTKEIRNSGDPVTESQTLTGQTATRSYTVTLGAWTNSGAVTSCSNWSPDPSTQTINSTFAQTATDCKQAQTRSRVEKYVDHISGSTVTASSTTESQSITASSTRSATGTKETWAATTSTYSAWANVSGKTLYSCSNWSPAGSTKTATATFTQTATNCSTDQTRTRQDREMESTTKEIRNSGDPVTESQTLTGQTATRSYTVTLGAWTNSGAVTACSNWSPDPSTQTINSTFIQTATDCKQAQTRSRVEKYVDHISGSTVTASSTTESQSITASSTRSATGTKETWAATTSTYTAWTNVSGKTLYSCSNWTPAGSTKTATSTFTQTATNCSTDQTRTRQDREMESTTKEIRNTGSPVTESQTLTGQTATRSYTVTLGAWTNSGAVTSCSNWSPDPSTQTINSTFTQTATDCKQAQTRSRVEKYVDHISGSTVTASSTTESQSITASSTRSATGTKETWVATTSVYSAWSNSGAISGCTAWSPSPSNYTVQTQFTQTGTGCSVAQTRTRQDRQVETTTGAVRNNGSLVTETQTATGQTTTRQYLMDFSGWSDSGGYYNCSAYSPDASTVTSGTSFTQTATCSINQTRGAAGYTLVNGAWASDPAVPYRTESQAVSRAVSQTATGTMPTTQCLYDGSSYLYHYTMAPPRVGTTPIRNTTVNWAGSRVYFSSSSGVSSVSVDGYTYSMGTVVSGSASSNAGATGYVCRSPN